MTAVQIECQFPECDYVAEHNSEAVALAMFGSHNNVHQQPAATPAAGFKQKAPKIDRPELKQDIDDEEWHTFEAEWRRFKRCTDIRPGDLADQLFQCCEPPLRRLLLKENPTAIEEGETALLVAMKNMAVLRLATSVLRTNLIGMKQDHGESFREYYANVRHAASICQYAVKCPNTCCDGKPNIDYTSTVVKDVLIAGIADAEIRKDLLGWAELDNKSDKDIVNFVEEKEVARKACSSSTLNTAALSSYRRSNKNKDSDGKNMDNEENLVVKKKLSMKGKCSDCGVEILLYKRYKSGRLNKDPFKTCISCFKNKGTPGENTAISNTMYADAVGLCDSRSEVEAICSFVGACAVEPNPEHSIQDSLQDEAIVSQVAAPQGICYYLYSIARYLSLLFYHHFLLLATHVSEIAVLQGCPQKNSVLLDHHIFTPQGWEKARALSHPMLRLRVTTHKNDYEQFNVEYSKVKPVDIDVVVDSGAQSCLWSRREFLQCGFKLSNLIKIRHTMKAANTHPISIDGAIILHLSGTSEDGLEMEAAVMTYVSPDAKAFYMSREAMIQLGIIPNNFPQIGAVCDANELLRMKDDKEGEKRNNQSLPSINIINDSTYADCGCLRRTLPPGKPDKLPFTCTAENTGKMKQWLMHRYESSTFNKCPHQTLPKMDGPPIKIHIAPDAKPVAIRTAAPVPLHWQEKVEEDLNRDVDLGVIERVPHGEPTRWCFRMVVTRKHDGGPRRTVDLSPLNKFCHREAHSCESPFNLAHSVPQDSVKTVLDAWNGFHSVPIREEDRHLTTFTTPWGLFRYLRAPQGFLSSGDGFNKRFDDITAHVLRMKRCVDDTLLHDQDAEEHWWRVIKLLEVAGAAGIVMNPEKFQFAGETVDFAGFRISSKAVEPLPKYIDAIRHFPSPTNTTDIRSWFGLVNQVSHYAQLRDMMEPYRKFLSPKTKFEWTDELDGIFEESKSHIISAIKEGVKIFDPKKRTCLRTDWSKMGIGYYLSQQHCSCKERLPNCCNDGWKITLAGSRFLSSAERNYVAVEGEALAVAWSLEQTRFFTMGCEDLVVVTDHNPLVKILGDRRLDEIHNPRLFRLKQRTLMWKFDIVYQPGKTNPFADAVSRHPNKFAELASIALHSDGDHVEEMFVAGLSSEMENFFAVTWQNVRRESLKDSNLVTLITLTRDGFPNSKKEMPHGTDPFWEFRHQLTSFDGVVLLNDRIVIPDSLKGKILENLHSAHQGVSSMMSRAQSIVFWPGITNDIEVTRNFCRPCNKNAPSQARMPPVEPRIPKTPFEMIYADFFDLHGKHYLIIGDRLTGWTEVVKVKPGSNSSGAKGLCTALRYVFATFGVPEEISSDGGPEFIAKESQNFFTRWGTKHRLSSAYFPQSNGRAECAVKATKRLLESNVGSDGDLNTDKVVRALLQQRNTPDRDCKLSPAEILFGHPLRDTMPQLDKSVMIFQNNKIHNQWHQAWAAKENAIRSRLVRSCENLKVHSRGLEPLSAGDEVFIQNQNPSDRKPNKWDRQGTVMATRDHDQYLIKVAGTGRLTLRNRRFLRKFKERNQFTNEASSQFLADNLVDLTTEKHIPSNFELYSDTGIESLPQSDPFNCRTEIPVPAPTRLEPNTTPQTVPADMRLHRARVTSSPDITTDHNAMHRTHESLPIPVTFINVPQPVRRSSREKNPRRVYNADTGTYILPNK